MCPCWRPSRGEHPIIETLIAYRQLSKLLSTYLLGLHPLINPNTGRIHTHFNQMATVTGRLSSTEPNLQNIPTRTDVGRRMREMFVPGEGLRPSDELRLFPGGTAGHGQHCQR